ncbi:MAG TPA: hypothetical protein VF476_10470 [Chitinophagaceae bacterium]
MNYKLILLRIISENQLIGIHKLDRLFYDEVGFDTPWPPMMEELKKDGLVIHDAGYKITKKGLAYLGKSKPQ